MFNSDLKLYSILFINFVIIIGIQVDVSFCK